MLEYWRQSLWNLTCFDIIQMFRRYDQGLVLRCFRCCWWLSFKRCVLLHKSFLFFFVLSDSFSGSRILKLYNCPHSLTILEAFKAASLPAVGQYKLLKKKKNKAKEIQYKIYWLNQYQSMLTVLPDVFIWLKHKSLELALKGLSSWEMMHWRSSMENRASRNAVKLMI